MEPKFDNYKIFEDGTIYSTKTQKTLIPFKHSHGYSRVALCVDGKKYYKYVHRLVALEFIPNPDNKKQVNHKNGVKTDNRVKNLEWATNLENCTHSSKYGLISSKLDLEQVRQIRELYSSTNLTQKDLSLLFPVNQSTISSIVTYRSWKDV